MSTIPKEIQEEIAYKGEMRYGITNMGKYLRQEFISGAEYGYQLATDGREELEKENERLKEQYSIMDGRRERAIKSLEESEKQFAELQEAYNKLIGS